MRRASISIPSNISEGFGRNSKTDFQRFIKISLGSLYEIQTQLILSFDLDFVSEDTYKRTFENLKEIERMIHSFLKIWISLAKPFSLYRHSLFHSKNRRFYK